MIGGHNGERVARASNGGLEAKPPAGSRARALGEGSGSEPSEAESLFKISVEKFALFVENLHTFYCTLHYTHFSLLLRLPQHNK